MDDYKFYKLVDKIYLEINKLTDLHKECSNELSKCDLEIQDMLHLAELTDIDNDKKVDFVDAIKKVRERRRNYKNELELITYFTQPFSRMKKILNNVKTNAKREEIKVDYQKLKDMFSTKKTREETLKNL